MTASENKDDHRNNGPNSIPPTQPSRGNEIIKELDTGTTEPKKAAEKSKGKDLLTEKKLRLAPGALPSDDELMSNSTKNTKDKLLRLAPGAEPISTSSGRVTKSKTNEKTNFDQSNEKLRLAPGVNESENTATRTLNDSSTSNGKLQLAPGVDNLSGSLGDGRSRDNLDGSDDLERSNDVESNLVEAEIAPDMNDMVETEVQRRVQALDESREEEQRRREEEQRQNVVVVEIIPEENPENDDESEDDKAEEKDDRSKKWKRWSILILVTTVVAATATGIAVWLTQSSTTNLSSEDLPTSATTTSEPTTPATDTPSPPPSLPPTMLREKVESILADFEPFDEEAMNWLTEVSTWKPPEGDPNTDYLWLERYALASLYFSANGMFWNLNNNWLTSEPVCNWYFEESPQCDDGPITVLNLDSLGLEGTLPPVLFELTALKEIRMGSQRLQGSIPESIGKLTNLTHLRLWVNKFSGSIPTSIGLLTGLAVFAAGGNQLTGKLPESIRNLNALGLLSLWDNNLTGTIPSSLGNMIMLTNLGLNGNDLSGTIPILNPNLEDCRMSGNCFAEFSNGVAAGCTVDSNCA